MRGQWQKGCCCVHDLGHFNRKEDSGRQTCGLGVNYFVRVDVESIPT